MWAIACRRPAVALRACLRGAHASRRAACRRRVAAAGDSGGQQGAEDAGYLTLAVATTTELEVKKSKFLATAWPITSAAQAHALVAEASDPAASHNCYAWRLNAAEFRSADDGEPGGTAGRPILGAIEGEGLQAVCVLVVRHFGGTKLGAGGLACAYGSAARECLRQGQHVRVLPTMEVCLQAPFQHIGAVYQLADAHGAERLAEEYLASGEAVLRLRLRQAEVTPLNAALADATAGAVQALPV